MMGELFEAAIRFRVETDIMLSRGPQRDAARKGRQAAYRRTTFETMEERLALSSVPLPMGVYSADYDAMTGLDHVRENYGLTGSGQTVVVIDSGIAYDHEALGGGFGDGHRVVGGYDFAEDDANPYDDGPYGSHGTHVSGILASDDADHLGVAPGVDIVSLRIFDDQGNSEWSWLEEALQWVHENLNTFDNPITTVNLSVGADLSLFSGLPYNGQLEDELAQLERDGIFISVAAGNAFQSDPDSLAYPAMSESVVAVSSYDMWGNMSYFSQRDTGVLVAPGQSISSSVPDYLGDRDGVADDYARFSGTSMAAPYVAGASVLLREAMMSIGMTDIMQDDLYTVMYDTADLIFDSVTGESYHRLNLEKAFEAIFPQDDYASDADGAHFVGTVVDSLSFSGTLTDRMDLDYFQIVAHMSGTMQLSAEEVAGLASRWETVGLEGATLDDAGNLLVEVVAGQSYTFGIGSESGLGQYTITASIEGSDDSAELPAPVEDEPEIDWGTPLEVDSRLLRDLKVDSSGTTVAFQATHSGLFTVEVLADGEVFQLERVDRSGNVLARSVASEQSGRLDLTVNAGEEILLKIQPTDPAFGEQIDLRVTNLLEQAGGSLTIVDTVGDDRFSFASEGARHTLVLNGTTYQFDADRIHRIEFASSSGSDTLMLSGTSGNDRVRLEPETTTMTARTFVVSAGGFDQVEIEGGGGRDYATFRDSLGDDRFIASMEEIRFEGDGFTQRLTGFRQASVVAGAGGDDTAILHDTPGNDIFVSTSRYAMLSGGGYSFRVYRFDTVQAIASKGGFDRASFTDSAGDDFFEATPDRARFSGGERLAIAEGFRQVSMISHYGGEDRASLRGSVGDEMLVLSGKVTQLAGREFHVSVKNFDEVHGDGGGGHDRAWLFDDLGDTRLHARGNSIGMIDSALEFWGDDFEEVVAQSRRGGKDVAEIGAIDYLLQLIGAWQEK